MMMQASSTSTSNAGLMMLPGAFIPMDATTSILTLKLLMIVSLICRVLVFINSKSGGQLGGDLLCLLNHNHVAGGDGTAGWLLGVVCDLKLSHPPLLLLCLWGLEIICLLLLGKKNLGTDRESVVTFLKQVMKAKEMKIDNWLIMMRMRALKEGSCGPIAPLELPHSLHAFQRVSSTDELYMEGDHTFCGGFCNDLCMGMDAQVSYPFHSERKLHPEKFENQLINQSTYAKLGCTQGWFAASLFHPASKNIAQLAKEKIMKIYGQWQDLHIPHRQHNSIRFSLSSGKT